jgi:dihydrodipicolinate synthase/N-acetylneuraminate lyase
VSTDKGIYVANLTAFRDGKLDLDAMRSHAEFLVAAGVAGLCPAGTTGEFLYLTPEEKKALFSAIIDAFRGRARIMCCAWDASPDAMADLCRHVSDRGADAIFLPPPLYYKFSESEIIAFYEFARNHSGIPIYCYNIPKYSNNEITLPILDALATRGTIAGVKDSSADEKRIETIIGRFGGVLDILAGGDHFVLKAREMGAHGFISALGNAYPELFVRLWLSRALELQEQISRIRSAIKGYGGIPALKYLLSRRGFSFGCRFPFQELDDSQKRRLDSVAPSEILR